MEKSWGYSNNVTPLNFGFCSSGFTLESSNARVSLSTHRQTCRSRSMLEAWDLLAGRSMKNPEPAWSAANWCKMMHILSWQFSSPLTSRFFWIWMVHHKQHGGTGKAWIGSCRSCLGNLLSFFHRSPLIGLETKTGWPRNQQQSFTFHLPLKKSDSIQRKLSFQKASKRAL